MLKFENLCYSRHCWYQARFLLPAGAVICRQLIAHNCTLLQTVILAQTTCSDTETPQRQCHTPLQSLAISQLTWGGKSQPLYFKERQLCSRLCAPELLCGIRPRLEHSLLYHILAHLLALPCLAHQLLLKSPPSIQHTICILVIGSASRVSVHFQSQVRKLWPTGQSPVCANKVLLKNSYACQCTYCLWLLLHHNGRPK